MTNDLVDIFMPQFGMGMQEGRIGRWHKNPGDTLAAGDVIADIESEKTTTELEVACAGTLIDQCVAEGDLAAVGSVIARVRLG